MPSSTGKSNFRWCRNTLYLLLINPDVFDQAKQWCRGEPLHVQWEGSPRAGAGSSGQLVRIFSVPSWASYIPSCLGIFLGIQIKENIRKRCTREYISEFLVEQHGSFENVSEGTQRSRITPLEKNQAGVDLPLAISHRWLTMIVQVEYLITLTRQAFLKAQAITMMRLIIWM